MDTIEQTLAEEALDQRVAELTGDWPHVATLHHADGSVTVIRVEQYDTEYANPREDDGKVSHLTGGRNRDYGDPDEGAEDSGIEEARDRWDGGYTLPERFGWTGQHSGIRYRIAKDGEYMVRRYLAMFRPDVVHYDEWSVSGSSQSDWNAGYGYVLAEDVERTGITCTPAEAYEQEVKVYGEWFAGEVYYATNLTVGGPIVTYGEQGAYVSSYEVDEESLGMLLGYPDNAAMAATVTDSPVIEEN